MTSKTFEIFELILSSLHIMVVGRNLRQNNALPYSCLSFFPSLLQITTQRPLTKAHSTLSESDRAKYLRMAKPAPPKYIPQVSHQAKFTFQPVSMPRQIPSSQIPGPSSSSHCHLCQERVLAPPCIEMTQEFLDDFHLTIKIIFTKPCGRSHCKRCF